MEATQKVEIFLLAEELFNDEGEGLSPAILTSLAVSGWPHRLNQPRIHVDCLVEGGSASYFAEHADDASLEKVTRLDRTNFDYIYTKFEVYWKKAIRPGSTQAARLRTRKLSGPGCMAMILYWLAHGPDMTQLIFFSGTTEATVSRYLKWGLPTLLSVMESIPEATLDCPPPAYLERIGELAGLIYGEVMSGCCIVTDGSLHCLEKDADAQDNFFYDEWHPDYNGWKGCYCKKALYFFCLDGTICWYCVDCPGSWADGGIFDKSAEMVQDLPPGCWILGDSAFAVRAGRASLSQKRREPPF
jgi:hypothetical protein